jgi:hypothetical protein
MSILTRHDRHIQEVEVSDATRLMIGITLLLIPTIEYGGYFLLSLYGRNRAMGHAMSAAQHNFSRAGHAHAGVLVILGLICQLLVDSAQLSDALAWLVRIGVVVAPMLVSAGFFLGAPAATGAPPGRLVALVYYGAALLALCLLILSGGLIRTVIA